MKYLFFISIALAFLSPMSAGAAPMNYTIEAIFEADSVNELGYPDGSVCRASEPCYPTGFRLQGDGTEDRGGYWSGLNYGDRITARFSFDPDDFFGFPDCDIAGWTGCGDFFSVNSLSSTTDEVDVDFFRDVPTSSVSLNLFDGTIRYQGEAGSFRPSNCSLTSPNQSGLPGGFCDYAGYSAEFSVVRFSPTNLVPVPLPASMPLLLISLLGLGAWGRRTRRS